MRIAFDLDGVVLSLDLAILRLTNLVKSKRMRDELMKYYCFHRTMQLNPLDFAAPGDEVFFITGRDPIVADTTKAWAKKYFPMIKLIMTRVEQPKKETLTEWFEVQAEAKAKALRMHKIEVYFDDNPAVVTMLRKLCPDVKIIQYGCRLDKGFDDYQNKEVLT